MCRAHYCEHKLCNRFFTFSKAILHKVRFGMILIILQVFDHRLLFIGGFVVLEIGSVIDEKYKILSQVGQGGMSVVYMAINEKANKTWAVKEVRKDGVLDFEAVKQGLVAETDILKKLSHPNLPSIIDVIDKDDSFIIIMDYIQGNSLNRTLQEHGAQPQELVIEWAKQLCDVLGYLHSRQPPIIYRDMKPANVMLKPDGNIALIDFGTAREFKERNLADTICLGTPGYAAPEQFGGMGQTDARTDIYCLGATLYHLITGYNPSEPPYEMKPIRQINPSLSSGFERIILKCTQRNPDDRYQSTAELMYALEHYEEIDDKYRKKQRNKLALFISLVSLCLIFLIGGFTTRNLADRKATDTYQVLYTEALKTSDYNKKIELFEQCIAVPEHAGVKDAYLGLIQTYKDDDSAFSDKEAKQLEKLITNNKDALLNDPEGYTEICFETGKLFWYYYTYGYSAGVDNQMTRAASSVEWFEDVKRYASPDYENLGMAEVYAALGVFYRNIATYVTEADDRGKYRPLFDNLTELIDKVGKNEKEPEIVRLELMDISRGAIRQYATNFKKDGVSIEEVEGMLNEIETITLSINPTTEITESKQSIIKKYMKETKSAVDVAYGTTMDEADSDDMEDTDDTEDMNNDN